MATDRTVTGPPTSTGRSLALSCALVLAFGWMLAAGPAHAQQFMGDNQWVAPHGVATIVGTAGEEYAQFYAVAALIPDWEFNLQITQYYDDPRGRSEGYTATSFYVKQRLQENEAQTTGYAYLAGTGLFPEHTESGQVTQAGQTWWATAVGTYGFHRDRILLDILPGAVVDFDQGESGDTAWGFTYNSRIAVYDLIPSSAVVAEVFGTAGEASADPAYRIGVRWESPKFIMAATWSDAFDGSGAAGFEFGLMYLTDARFCFGGCDDAR